MYVLPQHFEEVLFQIRSNALSDTCTAIVFVAPSVSGLASARLLLSLLRQDFVQYKLVPVFNYDDLKQAAKRYVAGNDQIDLAAQFRTVVLLECGANTDLSLVFSDSTSRHIFVIDSHRPYNLENVFVSKNIFVVDDGEIEKRLQGLGAIYNAEMNSVPAEDEDEDDDNEDDSAMDEASDKENRTRGAAGGKRARKSSDALSRRQRRRSTAMRQHPDVRAYLTGSYYGASAAELVYVMSTQTSRDTKEGVWLAIVGLTEQLLQERLTHEAYSERIQPLQASVSRYISNEETDMDGVADSQAEVRIRYEKNEYRFMLYRHWSVYEAMYHSPYVATRLTIWSEDGRNKFCTMLAKMGAPLQQAKEKYTAMALDIKQNLQKQLRLFAPTIGLSDYTYPSFVKEVGYRTPMSAADVVHVVSALLEAPGGDLSTVARAMAQADGVTAPRIDVDSLDTTADTARALLREHVWSANIFRAYDALDPANLDNLMSAINLAIEFQRIVVRLGTSLIDRKAAQTSRNFRYVVIDHDPDVVFFVQPLSLTRLALFVMQAINEQKNKSVLSFVMAALNAKTNMYTVVGVMCPSRSAKDVRKKYGVAGGSPPAKKAQFGMAFLQAAKDSRTPVHGTGFDSSVIEVPRSDLSKFLESLQTLR